uniref:Uncharacterized protein n=1 Tax=Siphoviridae sp. ct2vX3 TaxID=2825318 RepID=A0A8S5PY58_9CAUD|nr:MAG TPA: hypothetical protein [Siphoviridae sp. ct2vX3]
MENEFYLTISLSLEILANLLSTSDKAELTLEVILFNFSKRSAAVSIFFSIRCFENAYTPLITATEPSMAILNFYKAPAAFLDVISFPPANGFRTLLAILPNIP